MTFQKIKLIFMLSPLLLLVFIGCVFAFKPCQPFGTRIFYGSVVQDSKSNDKLHIYFNTAAACDLSYVQLITKKGLDKVVCEVTALHLSKEVNFYETYVHKCKISSINFGETFHYNAFGWDGGSANPIPFSNDFIRVKIADVTDNSKKVNLIVLADWSYLETTRYTSLDQLFATITTEYEIHGLLINGDVAYDLITNNCKNYEKFIVMLSGVAKSIPVIFATGNHEYATEQNFQLYKQSFEMHGIDEKFASGVEIGPVFLAPFDPFNKVYNDDLDVDPCLYNFQNVLKRAVKTGKFIVSSSHYPMACSGSDENCVDIPIKLKRYWDAMFQAKVRLYFGAHDHSYQRTLPYYQNGTFSSQKGEYNTGEDYIISIVEGVAGNDEGIVEEIEEIKEITAAYTVKETGLGLLEVDTVKVKYSHFSTKRGKVDEVVINRLSKRNLIRH